MSTSNVAFYTPNGVEFGDGSTQTAAYSNVNVANYLPTYTGPIQASNISLSGNIQGDYFLGNGSLLSGLPTSYSNVLVASFLSNLGSNVISTTGNVTASYLIGNGSFITGTVPSANLADTVTNSNQPNITTVGTLTGLATDGSISAAGSVTSYAFFGDGGYLSNLQGIYSNSLVANYLENYGSNVISTTGNITAGYFIGNGALLTGMPAPYSNSNVAAYLPTYSGNIANLTITGNSNLGPVTNVTITGGTNGQLLTTDGNGVLSWASAAVYGNSNVANYLPTYAGVIGAGTSFIGGYQAGLSSGSNVVAIGNTAGSSSQGTGAVAVGAGAGFTQQGNSTVAIGLNSGQYTQGTNSVAIGEYAGYEYQGINAVALGGSAGYISQGNNAVAIGYGAGNFEQAANSIILNATGQNVNANTSGFFVTPVNNATTSTVVYYNPTTYQLTYGNVPLSAAAGSNTELQFNSGGILGASDRLTWDGVNLGVTGNVNATYLNGLIVTSNSNIRISGGSSGYALVTDGSGNLSWASIAATYGNSNVAAFLENYGSNTFSSTGSVTSANVQTGNLSLYGNTVGSLNSSTLVIDPGNDGTPVGNLVVLGSVSITGNLTYTDISAAITSNLTWVAADDANTSTAASGGGLIVGNANAATGFQYATWLYNSGADSWVSNIGISAVGNIKGNFVGSNANLLISGGSSGQILTTDGTGNLSWASGSTGYSNALVASFLSNYGSNVISTTGNISANYFIGNGAFLTNIPPTYSNANVAAYLPTYDGVLGGGLSAAVGGSASAPGLFSVAVGYSAVGSQSYSVAIGQASNVTGALGTAVGSSATVTGIYGVAIGADSDAVGGGIAMGPTANSAALDSIAIGSAALTTSSQTIAMGKSTQASGTNSVAIGAYANAAGNSSIVLNATGSAYASTTNGFFVDPVRNLTGTASNVVYYNDATNEFTYGTAPAASASGSNTQIQFNDAGALAGNTNLTWDGTTLSVGGNVAASGNITSNFVGNIINVTTGNANLHITGGTNGQFLQTDGTGNLTWATANGGSGNTSPGGSNTQIQFNNAGAFDGSANLTWNGTTLSVGGNVAASGNITSNFVGNIINVTTGNANLHITGGTSGQFLQTDGNGNLTWATANGGSGNTSPGGSNTQIQFNDAGTFGGSANLTWNGTTLSVGGNVAVTGIDSAGYLSATGNVSGSYILGNGALLTGLGATYSNTDVASYMPTYTGQLGSSSDVSAGSGASAATYSVGIGRLANAAGLFSVVVGSSSNTNGTQSIAIGYTTSALGAGDTAIGSGATANGGVAVGSSANASGGVTTAIGASAVAAAFGATSVGGGANASGSYSTAIGYNSDANGAYSVGIGYLADAAVSSSIVINSTSTAVAATTAGFFVNPVRNLTGSSANAVFYNSSTNEFTYGTAPVSAAAGSNTQIQFNNDGALAGNTNLTWNGSNLAVTGNTVVTGIESVIGNIVGGNIKTAGLMSATGNITAAYFIGNGALLTGLGATYGNADVANYMPTYTGKLGSATAVSAGSGASAGSFSVGIGQGANAAGSLSVVVGSSSNTVGTQSIAIGYTTRAIGGSDIAIGSFANANGGVAVGSSANASAGSTTAIGDASTAAALAATSVGALANASGSYSTVIGYSSRANGTYSVGLGYAANAAVNSSIVINATSGTIASTTTGFFVKPVRNLTGSSANTVFYNSSTSEFTYGAANTAAAGANTQIQFNNAGSLGGNANLTWNGTTMSVGGNIAVTGIDSAGYLSAIGNITGGNVSVSGNVTARLFTGNISNLTTTTANLHITGGTNGQFLQTNGAGNISWVTGGGSGNGVVGGANTQIQFNNAGAFGGSANLTWDGANLSVVGNINSTYLNGNIVTSNANIQITGGTNGQVLTTDGAGSLSWTTASGGGNGLYSGQIVTPPVLSSWTQMNIASPATVADSSVGPIIRDTFGTGPRVRALYKTAPTAPYTITALVSAVMPWYNFSGAGLMFTDGTKVQGITAAYFSNPCFRILNFNSATSFNSDATSSQAWFYNASALWLQISDDGTNVSFSQSSDGVNYSLLYSVAKASGFLGSTGYTNVGFFLDVEGTAQAGTTQNSSLTLLSWSVS